LANSKFSTTLISAKGKYDREIQAAARVAKLVFDSGFARVDRTANMVDFLALGLLDRGENDTPSTPYDESVIHASIRDVA
jgi:hypothetical protein